MRLFNAAQQNVYTYKILIQRLTRILGSKFRPEFKFSNAHGDTPLKFNSFHLT